MQIVGAAATAMAWCQAAIQRSAVLEPTRGAGRQGGEEDAVQCVVVHMQEGEAEPPSQEQ